MAARATSAQAPSVAVRSRQIEGPVGVASGGGVALVGWAQARESAVQVAPARVVVGHVGHGPLESSEHGLHPGHPALGGRAPCRFQQQVAGLVDPTRGEKVLAAVPALEGVGGRQVLRLEVAEGVQQRSTSHAGDPLPLMEPSACV